MSDLNNSEKRKLEKFLGMSSGYVLDFSDRTFAEFVSDSTGRNIFDQRYQYRSGSKANRLRAFWAAEDNAVVGKLLNDLIDAATEGVRTGALVEDCRRIAQRLCRGSDAKTATETAPHRTKSVQVDRYEQFAAVLKDLTRLTPQPRGFAFERFLDDFFSAFDLSPRQSFRLVGEQIDGSFHFANDVYLVEAKWHDAPIGNRELQAFAATVRTKATWSRGLFISYSGFSEEGLTAFARGDATRIICMEGKELWQIIEHRLDLCDVLSWKIRRAAETGRAYTPLRELFAV